MTENRERRLVLGTTVRTLGAWPAGWRYPGAHRDPAGDPAVLTRTALAAEAAGLDFLFFGDWLATSAEFEHTDPYLLARVEPFAAIGYLAAVTERIGLIATVSSSHSEPYTTARSSASIDLLSGGRVALCVATGAEARSASNFGWTVVHSDTDRFAAAGEFIDILRGLWDSWEDDAFVSDAATGRLIDPSKLHPLGYVGQHRASSGPLNVIRPPQGHPPIAVVGGSPNARQLAIRDADLLFASPRTFDEAVAQYAEAKALVAREGRDPDGFRIVTPILPIVAETREGAWEIYDRLVALVPVPDEQPDDGLVGLPSNRSVRTLASVLGVPLSSVSLDDAVPTRVAARFSSLGKQLVDVVRGRSGRTIAGERPITYRHLLVGHAVAAPVLVGSAVDVAAHFETWFRAEAVDGFTVLSAFSAGAEGEADSFGAFAELVVPELRRRGLLRDDYEGATLRDHLDLPAVPNGHLRIQLQPL
ncbi:FMN-dependent oxidoreductase (nitrilotriacetate monooxygenase family) [Conyzicola lurida]|uniref:FMN-dependent oxidoreductase (Nitrilotriacetate monooxygenase family) n=1 Tax=Conyzicola lurida TaxID=1172621 RepID=A0A841AKF9_9MICO|nr:FMN-dependent oxidoreductase (nitrilotriacetate monooxygenase family) [Conyzicola lurida]